MKYEITEHNYLGFDLRGKTSGKIYTTCAHCSSARKKPKDPCCTVNIDKGYYTCHHCGEWGWLNKSEPVKKDNNGTTNIKSDIEIPQGVYDWFAQRAITESTIKKAKIEYGKTYIPQVKKNRWVIAYPYYYYGELINKKFRDKEKNFAMISGAYKTLYNVDAIEDTKEMIIQEGEMDVLSSIECGIFNAVSVPNGATKGKNNLSYLDEIYDTHIGNKEKIILAGDNDPAGKQLHEDIAGRLGKHRCYVVDWGDCKDGNEYLIKHGKEKYREAISRAEPYPVAGIFTLDGTVLSKLEYELEHGLMNGETTHIRSLDERFTWLKKNVIVIGAYNNVGKSEFLYNLACLKAIHAGWKSHIAAFEDKTVEVFYRKLVEMYVGKSLDPRQREWNNQMSKQELKEAAEFIKAHFFFIRPPDGFTREAVMDLLSNSIARHGGDITIIDPLNKIIKDRTHLRDDEYLVDYYREQECFAVNHNVCAVTVTHVNKPEKITNGVPSRPYRFNLLGGQAAGNSVDEIILLHQPSSERGDTLREVIVDKVKSVQQVGIPGTVELSYNYRKRRYIDTIDGVEYDPFVGYEYNSKRTMPVIKPNDNMDYTTDYVPF